MEGQDTDCCNNFPEGKPDDGKCRCGNVKLIGCNLDSSFEYLSPRAKVKCTDLCRPLCNCPDRHSIVIRPGDGALFEQCQHDPQAAMDAGWDPPYDFSRNPHLERLSRKQKCVRPGFRITPDYCKYPHKDYILANAIAVARAVPKVPVPRIVVHPHGHTTEWCKSGLAKNHIFSKTFGKSPRYICGLNEKLAMEDYKLRCMLANQGRVCCDAGHNTMNKMILLQMQQTNDPTVRRMPFYIEPTQYGQVKDAAAAPGACKVPHPCFLPR